MPLLRAQRNTENYHKKNPINLIYKSSKKYYSKRKNIS